MDRQIVFPGSIPLDTDLLSLQRNIMVALGYLAQATLGGLPIADGLACVPTVPGSLTVTVGPGSIATLQTIDSAAFGSLPADSVDPLIKMGVNTTPTTFTLTAPTTSGQTINYLIQAALLENDASPVVLPYYNAANPAQPFSGPNNNGVAQNTQRLQRVQLQLKPGAPANAGSQVTPAIDSGWVGLYVLTVNYGQTQIAPGNIAVLPTAPFVQFKLNSLTPGFSRMSALYASTNFIVPNGVSRLKVRLCGGGGGAGASGLGGAGGGAGGYAEAIIQVTPGAVIPVTVGGGGNGAAGSGLGGSGGTSSFGSSISATGGAGGASAATYAPGGGPGSGSGGTMVALGGYGSDGNGGGVMFAGNGGASAFGGGGRAASAGNTVQQIGTAPGSGGGGCYGSAGNGGSGAAGIVIVEY